MDTMARLNELREERGLSMYRLAIICDVPYSSLKYTARNHGQLSVDTIERICLGLRIPMAEFFAEVK